MKLTFFYGLSIVSLVRGNIDIGNIDIDVLQQVGDGDLRGGGQGAEGDVGAGAGEETTTASPPLVWCDPQQGWQQTPNGTCYLIGPTTEIFDTAREYCRGLGHDIIEWSEATNEELKTIIVTLDTVQSVWGGAYRTDGTWTDKDGNAADVSSVGSPNPTRHCVMIASKLYFYDCQLSINPICQWSGQ